MSNRCNLTLSGATGVLFVGVCLGAVASTFVSPVTVAAAAAVCAFILTMVVALVESIASNKEI